MEKSNLMAQVDFDSLEGLRQIIREQNFELSRLRQVEVECNQLREFVDMIHGK